MNKKSKAIAKAMNKALHDSHSRLLDQALNETPEITDLNELRNKYPGYDFTKLKKVQALNIKINIANDFLIEEQSAWLDPSSRPVGGIEYHAHLFEERVFEDDKELSIIQSEQVDIDDK
jgi:hypothetical protein